MAAPEETAILPETEETAPVAEEAPAASENSGDVLAEAQIKDINGTVLLTPEEIREALDSGTLDEESIDPACLTGENGLLQWLWEFFFGKDEEETPQYSGWRTENGKTYYYDQNTHQPVTGIQSIDNKLYYFDASGVQQPATFGIDVSKYQSSIDWDKVKTAGVEFAIIRIGYRGYGSGALVQDPKFEEHFTNARNAGLRVGIYCFSQAVNENEAREEAQACVYVLNGRQLDYPIYFDTEASGAGNGRADGLGVEDRTKCAVAFCEEVKALGVQARRVRLHHLVPQAAGYEPAVQLLHLECPLQRGLQPHCLQHVAGHLHRPHPRLRRPDRCEHQLYGLSYGPYPLDRIRHGCHPSGRTKSAPGRL